MTEFNYRLEFADYTVANALLWGNCAGHFQKACEGEWEGHKVEKIVHGVIAVVQFLPVISQIASLIELLVITCFADMPPPPPPPPKLDEEEEEEEKEPGASAVPDPKPPAGPVGEIPRLSSRLTAGQIDLVSQKYPDGCTQYKYPTDKGQAQACSYISSSSVLHIAANFSTICEAFRSKKTDYLMAMQRAIIDAGLKEYALCPESRQEHGAAVMPESVEEHSERLKVLNLKAGLIQTGIGFDITKRNDKTGQDEVVGLPIEKQYDKIFSPIVGKMHNFAVVQIDGQSLAIFQIDDELAFIYDSHKSWFRVADRAEINQYLLYSVLQDGGDFQGVDFYHGQQAVDRQIIWGDS